MTIASLLLALCTAAPSASSDAASQPVLLDFHAEWCGPCQKMRPVIKQLIRNKYPVRSIDIDHDPDRLAARYHVRGRPHLHRGRRLGPRAGSHQGHIRPSSWRGFTRPPRPRQSRRQIRTTVSPRVRNRGPVATTMKRTREPGPVGIRAQSPGGRARGTGPNGSLPTPNPGNPRFESAWSVPTRPVSARAPSSTAHPRSR